MNGIEIRNWRAANRIKQESLATMLGISRVAVSKWESGVSRPSKVSAIRLAEVISRFQTSRLREEIAIIASQKQVKALTRGTSMRLIGLSAGYRAQWPEMTNLIGMETRQ
ncbi:MAG: helix-turn-helix domain-containing protein [Rhodobacterales bacterium]